MTTTFTLSKPLLTHSGEVSTLTLNEPKARAFIKFGEPMKLKWISNPTPKDPDAQNLEIDYNNANMMKFIVSMCEEKVDELVLENISGSDFMRLRNAAADVILNATGNEQNPTQP